MARLRSVGISPVFREALYSSWRGWARLLLHFLRSIAGNSSGPLEEFCEIVFIASMMSSLVILMSDSVFPCGCPKMSFGYLWYGMFPKFSKRTADGLATRLCIVFWLLLRLGSFPACWRLANITPIPKGPPFATMANYRPISITPISFKVLERLLSIHRWRFMECRGVHH